MFNKNLGTCKLTDDTGNGFFQRIVGTGEWHFKRDYTLLALARALLYKRMGETDIFKVRFSTCNYSVRDINGNTSSRVFRSCVVYDDAVEGVTVVNIANSESAAALFAKLDDEQNGFIKCFNSYTEATDMRKFVEKYMNARFYISPSRKSTVIFAEKMDLRTYHLICSLFPRYIMWYLENTPLDAAEKELCRSLTDRYPLKYENAIAEMIKTIDFRSARIRSLIGDFERRSRQTQLRDTERLLDRIRNSINDNLRQYTEYCRQLDDTSIRLEGLRAVMNRNAAESELMQYMLRDKHIMPTSVDGQIIQVIIDSYLDVFDPEQFARMARNRESVLYEGYSTDGMREFRQYENRKMLLEAIFSDDPVLKIRTCGHFRIDVRGDVTPSQNYPFPAEYVDMIPNPHVDIFQCLGQNRTTMVKCLQENNIVGCLMQCLVSVKCLNMSDSIVIRNFMSQLFKNEHKIIELPDRTNVTVRDALMWLKNQNQATANQAQAETN